MNPELLVVEYYDSDDKWVYATVDIPRNTNIRAAEEVATRIMEDILYCDIAKLPPLKESIMVKVSIEKPVAIQIKSSQTNNFRGFRSDDDDDPGIEFEDAEIIRETSKAILWEDEYGEQRWSPKSVIHKHSGIGSVGDTGTLILKTWFCEKEKIGGQ